MKTLLRLLALLALATATLHAADNALIAAVQKADDERVAATKSADPTRLDKIFSDELRYAHSSGKIDTKASYVESLTSHRTVYETYDYTDRQFFPAGPGIVLMYGRAVIHSINDGQKSEIDLNFLAVWRQEGGAWRFLAWQSCKNVPPPPAPTPAKR
jgi:hypothetical protein